MAQILTMTTDFGVSDGYVGAMKGVVYGISPQILVVDNTHLVPPQDIMAGAFAMYSACRYFPAGTVHVGVVDPGVGSDRRGIVVETDRFFYVGPDNGLFSAVYANEAVKRIVEIENKAFMLSTVSSTFHGRDIFAPVGAHLLQGVRCDDIGNEVMNPITHDLWAVKEENDCVTGKVVCVDHFGNVVTMISRSYIDASRPFEVLAGDTRFDCVLETYAQVGFGESLVLYGSLDTIEIAVNGGSAAHALRLGRGDNIRVRYLG